NRSAVQPLAGMQIASDNRYEVTASFKARGLVPSACAITGSEVEITVESMFSMNKAVATISGTMRSEGDDSILGGYRLLRHSACRPVSHLPPIRQSHASRFAASSTMLRSEYFLTSRSSLRNPTSFCCLRLFCSALRSGVPFGSRY